MVKSTSIVAGLRDILGALNKALIAQLHPQMLLLSFMPFLFAMLLTALLLWFGLAPLNRWIDHTLMPSHSMQLAQDVLTWFGSGAIRTAILSMLAMWLLLPIMILAALIFVAIMAMPAINRHVADRQYSALECRHGGSLLGTLWISTVSFLIFIFLWIGTLPLSAIPPFTFLIHPALWGWLTYRIMAYDALAMHADSQERRQLMREHRWPLVTIGAVVGALGTVPTLLWFGGALSVVLLPLLAAGAVWLYVVIFIFSGLWFQYYCLEALARQRAGEAPAATRSSASLTMLT
ncbi:MAG: EI24 domain-containing protein [Pseudomonadota bacterium]